MASTFPSGRMCPSSFEVSTKPGQVQTMPPSAIIPATMDMVTITDMIMLTITTIPMTMTMGRRRCRSNGPGLQRFAAIAGPFGAAASPDLTILPVALAARAIGLGAVLGTLVSFTIVTLGTFVVLTVAATLAGYQVKGDWLEQHGNLITALVLIAIGVVVFLNLV